MKLILSTAVIFSLGFGATAIAQEADTENALTRPGDAEGTAMPSDGLAECAAILAAASSRSTNIINRNNLQNSSAAWFAASGDLAVAEGGALPEADVWATKVTDWSGRIGSVDAMGQHGDWMSYCTQLGQQQQLDVAVFEAEVEPVEVVETPVETETE